MNQWNVLPALFVSLVLLLAAAKIETKNALEEAVLVAGI
jgi:hypothetical protein